MSKELKPEKGAIGVDIYQVEVFVPQDVPRGTRARVKEMVEAIQDLHPLWSQIKFKIKYGDYPLVTLISHFEDECNYAFTLCRILQDLVNPHANGLFPPKQEVKKK